PHRAEHFLQDGFRFVAVAENVQNQAEEQTAVPIVQVADSARVAREDALEHSNIAASVLWRVATLIPGRQSAGILSYDWPGWLCERLTPLTNNTMPVYEFRCRACDHEFEQLVLPGRPEPACPECQSADLERKLSSFAVSSDGTRTRNVQVARRKATA